jgi:HSP20 family protein
MSQQSLIRQKPESNRQHLTDHLIEPFSKLRDEVEHVFDEFPARFPSLQNASRSAFSMPKPAVEMIENDQAYKISVEVPGIDIDDIDLSIQQDMLVLKGEKREEHSESDRSHSSSERTYGCFERHITLPADADVESIKANAKNGVLTIDIPRDKENKQSARSIPINDAAKTS